MKIFEPFQIKNITFQNRVVIAPMTPPKVPEHLDGTMSEELIDYYIDRASNQTGLLITQSLLVAPPKDKSAYQTGIYADRHKAGLKRIIEAYHKQGTKVFVQLIYPKVSYVKGSSINSFSTTDMERIRDEFVSATQRCKEAGCDGIEFHGAHGFFLNMMLSPHSNNRTDRYGGSFDGRLLLVKEIVQGIRSFIDDDFILSYRMGWMDTLSEDIQTARALEQMGIELLHISIGIPSKRVMELPTGYNYNEVVYTGTKIKHAVQSPVIVVDNIKTLDRGNDLLEHGECDFVAYGRPFLTDMNFLKNAK